MLVAGVLGFSCVVLVVLFVPVTGFVIRKKWRLAVARKEEIKRLLILASEEAARAELEVSAGYGNGYGYSAATISRELQCAVCYCPTTTRCARCKAVRYCSGKCQIIHWRQGHKEECRPPSVIHQINNEGSDSSWKAVKQEQNEIHGNSFDAEGRQCAEPFETFPEEPALFNSSLSPEVPCGKDDDIKVEFLADGKGTNSTSKSSSTSFSAGLSASTVTSESFVDGSVSGIISSRNPEKLDGNEYNDIAPDILETTSSVNDIDQTKPLSPEFTSTSLSKLNQIKPGRSDGETQSESTSFSGSSINHAEPSTASSGFWEGTLDSSRSRNDADDDSAPSNSSGIGDGNLSDSGSFLRFSFNFSGNTIPPLHSQGSEAKTIVADDAQPTNSGINKSIDGTTLSEKTSTDASKVRDSSSLSFEMSIHANDTSGDSHTLKSREFRSFSSSASHAHLSSSSGRHSISTDASKVSNLPSLSSEKSKHVVNGTSSTSHLLKSRKVESGASDAHLSSGTRGHSVPSMKPGKVDNGHAIPAISSQTASYSPNASNGLKTSVRKVVDQFRVPKLSKHHPSGVGSEIAGRYKGLFPYEFFVKLYNWNKVELRPCGLTNCGNSCYANVVLQCLAFTPPLNAYLLQGLHSKACVKKDWCFICEFESLILKAKEGNSPLSPIGILSQIPNIGGHLGNGREEDAHEFLRYAIDTMQSVFLKEAGLNASGSLEEETTLTGLTFGGYLRSKIKCMKCQGKSERHERMMDLTVEIEGDIGTLEEALRQFTGTEILDGENKYQCSRCKSYEKAKKKLTVLEAPNVLTIALKRFQSGKFGKLNKPIRFPEILDLAPYMSGTSDKSPIYRLYGVVVHLDVMNAAFSGHYVCYVKNIQNKWFKIDDSTVKAVELERVLTKGAYMLLYTRCSPRAPKLIRNTMITRDKKNQWDAVLSRNNGKNTTSKSRSYSPDPSVGQPMTSWIPSDGPASFEPIYPDETKIRRMPRIPEVDLSSENSSIFSCSDEGSWSTESTRDSTSTDDLSDYIFGDSGRDWNGPWRNSSDSDTTSSSSSSSSSSSPLYSRHSPLADSDRYASGHPETSGSQTDNADLGVEGDDPWSRLPSRSSRLEDLEGNGSVPFLYFDTTKQCRKLGSSSWRENDSERLGWVNPYDDDVKSGVSLRRSTRGRTD